MKRIIVIAVVLMMVALLGLPSSAAKIGHQSRPPTER